MATSTKKKKRQLGHSRTESGDYLYPKNYERYAIAVRDGILKSKKRILAVDLGMKYGYAYLSGKTVVCGYSDVGASRFSSQFASMHAFYSHMLRIIKEMGGLDVLLFEAVAFSPKSTYALQVNAWFLGALEAVAIVSKCHVVKGFRPSEIKGYATGKGNSSKEKMIEVANERFGLNLDPEAEEHGNTADAIHLLSLGCEVLFGAPPLHSLVLKIERRDQ